jgi:hypothetical protein
MWPNRACRPLGASWRLVESLGLLKQHAKERVARSIRRPPLEPNATAAAVLGVALRHGGPSACRCHRTIPRFKAARRKASTTRRCRDCKMHILGRIAEFDQARIQGRYGLDWPRRGAEGVLGDRGVISTLNGSHPSLAYRSARPPVDSASRVRPSNELRRSYCGSQPQRRLGRAATENVYAAGLRRYVWANGSN